jgi:glycosyltransferase involved in cell wall biosynthesis
MKVAIVAGIVAPADAISSAVEGQAELLATMPGVDEVVVFAQHVSRPLPCASFVVRDSWELVRSPAFTACDVAIFHWGIHYGAFDAISVLQPDSNGVAGPGPRPVVHFHNCTPWHLVPPEQRPTMRQSLVQITHAISLGTPLWTYSEFNRRTLVDWGALDGQIVFVPFPIAVPQPSSTELASTALAAAALTAGDGDGRVELLTVGRIVAAKGVATLVEAIALLPADVRAAVRLRVAGASHFSDAGLIAALQADAAALGDTVEFVLDGDDDVLAALYATSDVLVSPSLHEGLCIPVIEAYGHGLRAIGTDAGNLPFVLVAGDERVSPGDAAALAAAITRTVAAVGAGDDPHAAARAAVVQQYSVASTRRYLADALAGQGSRYDDAFHTHADVR